jgi:O-antigen/teichoic acid export membrane protein
MMIMVVEIFMFRLIEGLHKVNNGLGRFTAASLIFIMQSASRAGAAVLFAAFGGGSLQSWVDIYFITNALAALAAFALFSAPVRLAWDTKLFIGRFRDAVLFAFSSLTFDAQTEVDKVVFLVIAGDRAAGIYAISVRIIELAIIPVRTFYVLYSRKLIRERRHHNIVSRNLLIEGIIFAGTVVAYAVFLGILSLKPNLLGANVEVARQLFAMALLVPAFRSMMELHSELYFAYRKLGTQAIATLALVVLKALMIAAMVTVSADPGTWGYSLNWIFAGLYVLSALVVYRAIGMAPLATKRLPA